MRAQCSSTFVDKYGNVYKCRNTNSLKALFCVTGAGPGQGRGPLRRYSAGDTQGEGLVQGCLEEVGTETDPRADPRDKKCLKWRERLGTQAARNSRAGRRKGKETANPVIRQGRRVLMATGHFGHFFQVVVYLTYLGWYVLVRDYPQCEREQNS